MKKLSRGSYVAALLATGVAFASAEKKEPLVNLRHKPPSFVRTAEIAFPRYSESALMVSPCHPEEDGYFGGTYGVPIEFEYVFQMESTPMAKIDKALLAVRDRVIDELVSDTFPQLCGMERIERRLQENSHNEDATTPKSFISGFKFDRSPQIDLDSKLPSDFGASQNQNSHLTPILFHNNSEMRAHAG